MSAARESPAPPFRDDPRLLGDWELVGSTSPDMQERKGMTGLGAAPFTNVKHIFYRFEPTGEVLAKEVLEFFGHSDALAREHVHLMRRSDGRASGDAYAVFDSEEAAVAALAAADAAAAAAQQALGAREAARAQVVAERRHA